MGQPLFGVNISGLINQFIGPGVLAATLTKVTEGTRSSSQLSGGTNPVSTPYACRGFIAKQANKDATGTLVDDGNVTIVLIGDSISGGTVIPVVDDTVAIEGASYVINAIDRDPAAATYTCSSSKR